MISDLLTAPPVCVKLYCGFTLVGVGHRADSAQPENTDVPAGELQRDVLKHLLRPLLWTKNPTDSQDEAGCLIFQLFIASVKQY